MTGRGLAISRSDARSQGSELKCRIENLSVARGGRPVLSGVNLSLSPGEVTALEGALGSGKTSLIRAIARLIPSTGTIATGGARPALIFQHHALANRLTAGANTLVGALGRVVCCVARSACGRRRNGRSHACTLHRRGLPGSRIAARTGFRAGSASALRSRAP